MGLRSMHLPAQTVTPTTASAAEVVGCALVAVVVALARQLVAVERDRAVPVAAVGLL